MYKNIKNKSANRFYNYNLKSKRSVNETNENLSKIKLN